MTYLLQTQDTDDPGLGRKFKVMGIVLGEELEASNWHPFFVHDGDDVEKRKVAGRRSSSSSSRMQ